MRVGAIDIGTNTTRLLVAEVHGNSYREVDRRLTFTRLGEGVEATGELGRAAIERTLKTIADYCSVCGELDVSVVRLAATSAVREASNRQDFLMGAAALAGSEAEVLTGEQEARLSFLGATFDLGAGTYLVCDIGGGSTEFVVGAIPAGAVGRPQVASAIGLQAVSLDLGAVRLTEGYIRSDPVDGSDVRAMEAVIDEELMTVALPESDSTRFVGVAGTITSLAAIKLGLTSYDPAKTHGSVLSLEEADRIYRLLLRMTIHERKQFPSLPEGRADVIVAGAAILLRVMIRWSFDEVLISEKDILDGLVLDMMTEAGR